MIYYDCNKDCVHVKSNEIVRVLILNCNFKVNSNKTFFYIFLVWCYLYGNKLKPNPITFYSTCCFKKSARLTSVTLFIMNPSVYDKEKFSSYLSDISLTATLVFIVCSKFVLNTKKFQKANFTETYSLVTRIHMYQCELPITRAEGLYTRHRSQKFSNKLSF